jgi:hypothetical protein
MDGWMDGCSNLIGIGSTHAKGGGGNNNNNNNNNNNCHI